MKQLFTIVAVTMITVLTSSVAYSQVVTSSLDSGLGSLRQEIADANAGDTITFGPLVNTIVLLTQLEIDKALTITNTNALDVTISGASVTRIFNITAGPVNLNNLVITNGRADDGGAIYVANASVTITGCEITNSTANGASGSGGGIFNSVGGSLNIIDTEISGNVANRAGGGIEDNAGAGLNITLNNVILLNNNTGVAPAIGAPGNGGGLHITGPGSVAITGGMVNGNRASLEGGGLWNGTGTMTIIGTQIDGNTAFGSAANDGGGGIFNNGGTVDIDSANITDNIASGILGSGGGLFSLAGMVTINHSMFSGNNAIRAGGAIEILDGDLMFSNSQMVGNDVNGLAGTANPGNGGGLHVTGMASDINIENSMIMDNEAFSEGGGLWNQNGCIMTVSRTTIDGNLSFGTDRTEGGGGIFNNGGVLNVSNSTISNNDASGISAAGGGIHNADSGKVYIMTSTISTNNADGIGGGVYSIGDSAVLNAVTVVYNTTAGEGAGLYGETGIWLKNTIAAANDGGFGGDDAYGELYSNNYNLIATDDSSDFTPMANDIEGLMPMLGALQDNGGTTFTHALLNGSPGLNAGDPASTFNDQRDSSLVGVRDIGAYEYGTLVGINEVNGVVNSSVYPNPTTGSFSVAIAANNGQSAVVKVVSVMGQLVSETTMDNATKTLDIAALPAGVYYISVQTETSTTTHNLLLVK